MLDVHIVVINAIFGVTMLQTLDKHRHIVHPDILHHQGKGLAERVGGILLEFINHLLDINLARRGLTQIELHVRQDTVAQRHTALLGHTRQKDLHTTRIEQGVLLVVLHIEVIDTQATQRTDTDATNLNPCLQLLRHELGGTIHNVVLNRWQREHQCEYNGAKYQKQKC